MNQPVEHFALTAPGDPRLDTTRHITAPRGTKITCRNWLIEAAYRMIQNNLDPVSSTPGEFAAQIQRDIPRWARVVDQAKIAPE